MLVMLEEYRDAAPTHRLSRTDRFWKWVLRQPQMKLLRLRGRLDYMLRRYDVNHPYWQFVIWLRQTSLLVCVAFVPDAYLSAVVFADGAGATSYTEAFVVQAGIFQAVLAMCMILVFWCFHERAHPYPHRHQNRIESLLFALDVVVLIFGLLLNTLYLTSTPQWVEASLNTLLIGVHGVIVLFLLCKLLLLSAKRTST